MEEDEGTNMGEHEENESMGLPPTDNQAELTKFILDPEARKLYEHITKDFAVTNLNEEEMNYINLNLQLFHLIKYTEEEKGDFKQLGHVILQDIYSFLQVSRSKDGFERMAEITKKMDTKQKYTEDKVKKGFLGR
jgi:hypothetical protein